MSKLHSAYTRQLQHELLKAGNVIFKALREESPAIAVDDLNNALQQISTIALVAVKRNRTKLEQLEADEGEDA
mgnify:CR=1 FL=1